MWGCARAHVFYGALFYYSSHTFSMTRVPHLQALLMSDSRDLCVACCPVGSHRKSENFIASTEGFIIGEAILWFATAMLVCFFFSFTKQIYYAIGASQSEIISTPNGRGT